MWPMEFVFKNYLFGLQGERAQTLEEVGVEFNITRERVRQLQNSALVKIREGLRKKEKVRTREEIFEEKLRAERTQIIREFIHDVSWPDWSWISLVLLMARKSPLRFMEQAFLNRAEKA